MDLKRVWKYFQGLVANLLPKEEEATNDISLIYQPLQHRETRIITLAPGEWNDRIECALRTVSLDDNPSYEALSYCWGDPNDPKKLIFLQNQPFKATPSLESALRHLRHRDSERTMWIDAICTNQNDVAERTAQVQQMQDIYAHASHLVVWVGVASESEDSDLGMETCRQVGEELKEGDHWNIDLANVSLIKDPHQRKEAFDPKPWVAANRLFRRNWFDRVWVPCSPLHRQVSIADDLQQVIQEVCMPDAQMSFVCGSKSVAWESVSRASSAIQRYGWKPEQQLALTQAGYDYPNMDFPVNLVREVWKGPASVAEAECTLLKQLWHFKSRGCVDRRDKVYAILGICKDLRRGDITVDYAASVARVYSDVSRFIITRDRSLKLLSACQSYGSDVIGLPSWAPDWRIEARFRPIRPVCSWTGDDQSGVFNASGSLPARVDISADLRTMTAQGLPVGKIAVLGTHIENDGDTTETPVTLKRMFTLFQDWWPLAKNHTPAFTADGERRADAFWRTIITDMNSFAQKATRSVEGAQFRLWMGLSSPAAFEPEDLVEPAPQFMGFIASFRQATMNRRFFVTEEGRMGLGPRLIVPGDLVCVLLGSQVPFVLRRKVDGDGYVLVGECYCHGVMDGETVRGLDEGEVALRDFVLD